MPDYNWPDAEHRTLIGKRISRVDSPVKVSGRAKYTYDYRGTGMLYGKVLRSPYAKARVVSIDTSVAEKMPGVKAVQIIQKPGMTVQWAGDEVVAVAAVDESTAEDAVRTIKIKYQPLSYMVSDAEPPAGAGEGGGPLSEDDLYDAFSNQVPNDQLIDMLQKQGVSFKVDDDFLKELKGYEVPDPIIQAIAKAPFHEAKGGGRSSYQKNAVISLGKVDQAFSEAEVTSEGLYGSPVIVHCCLEAHGSVAEWPDANHLFVHISTQNVSGIPDQMAEPLNVPATNVRIHQDNIGGGFGSKFAADRWDITAARLSKKAGGKPVRIMLERDAELQVAGARPSGYARVKLAAKKDGTITGWQSQSWGTGGPGGGGMPPIPYIFNIPNQKKEHTAIRTNMGPARAWRAPNHPQAALITMGAIDDLAARLNMDPVELLRKNLDLAVKDRQETYREELGIASELMGWKEKWRPRGQNISGNIARGLGVSVHTWGGRGHASDCDLIIHPDGSVNIKMGTQDIGTGTRTTIVIVAAETLGLPIEAINLYIGDTMYPPSGGSGGSTTPGGVSSSTRRAAVDAREALFAKAAPALKAQPEELECVKGTIRVKGDPSRSLTWKQACAKIGAVPITVRGHNDAAAAKNKPDLTNSGVGGVGMADVEVDTETGIVKVKKMVAVQDCGLIIDLKLAESSCYGAMTMGISYALFEEKVMDPLSGRMLNPNMQFYRLAGLNDVPELVVHMMTGKGYDERGVIGLGEPPVISPGAAISNAVANAIGVRVPFLPLTPDRVLAALEQKAGA